MLKIKTTTTRSGPPLVDAVTFPIECPKCGHKTDQPVSRLKSDPTLTCPSCSNVFKIESQGTGRQVADQLEELDRKMANLFK